MGLIHLTIILNEQAAQTPWWASLAFSLVTLIAGAAIGFFATQLKDQLERNRTKTAFLTAVRYEIIAIEKQLQRTLMELAPGLERLQKGGAPQIVCAFSTSVFDSQLGKLPTLADPTVLRVVEFYSTLDVLKDLAAAINRESERFRESTGPDRLTAQDRVKSTLMVAQEEVMKYLGIISGLLPNLPEGGFQL